MKSKQDGLQVLAGADQRAEIGPLRSRSARRRATIQLLRLEDLEEHGGACFIIEGERWRWPRGERPRRTHRGLPKAAAPHALTRTPANASSQKVRVKRRRPRESKTIK